MLVTEYSEQNNKDKEKKNKDINIKTGYVIFTQFVLEVFVFMGGAIALGLFLDKNLGTKCLFLIILFFLFAFVPIYNLIKRVNNNNG